MVLMYGVVVSSGLPDIGWVAGQAFPLVLLLDLLDVLPAQVPLKTLIAKCFWAEIAEIDLSALATPPAMF